MGILVNINDFNNTEYRFQVNDFNEDFIEEFVDTKEKLWIKTILGNTLGAEFIANPTEVRWKEIKDPFVSHCGRQCMGLKQALVAFIYTDLIKPDGTYSAQSAQKVKAEVKQNINLQANYARAYNDGVEQTNLIRHKMRHHCDLFPNIRWCEHIRMFKSLPF